MPDKEAQWLAGTVQVLDLNYQSVGYFPTGRQDWGSFAPDTLDSYITALFESQLIPKANLPLDQIFSNRFVPEFNRIDPAVAAQRARQAEAALKH